MKLQSTLPRLGYLCSIAALLGTIVVQLLKPLIGILQQGCQTLLCQGGNAGTETVRLILLLLYCGIVLFLGESVIKPLLLQPLHRKRAILIEDLKAFGWSLQQVEGIVSGLMLLSLGASISVNLWLVLKGL